ncbi:StbB family protein [Paraburkholderia oxyphila]|uniref:StbB family protein n=1 Tax=Paraburkholderia oxyphila TaxID=614212 RepID=UPI000482C525|nr:StbB family protein [Paraburkholderia oxyphila]
MKIAVLNYSGSVGKTLVSHYFLAPRMPVGTAFTSIETVNESAEDLGANGVEQIQGKKFGDLLEKITLTRHAIVDIGASNIESFLLAMSKFDDSASEFDRYIVPVTPDRKAMKESAQTIDAISSLGVSADRILLLPNRIEEGDPVEEMPAIFSYVKKHKRATINPDMYLYESPIYEWLGSRKMSFEDLLSGDVDYQNLAVTESDMTKAAEYAKMYRRRREAAPVRAHMDEVFKAMFADMFTTATA